MKNKTVRRMLIYIAVVIVLLLAAWLWRSASLDNTGAKREIGTETVVVSQKSDPYYGLAERIAQEEALDIVEDFTDVFRLNPKFIILVASPDNLTADRLYEIGRSFKDRDYYPALGIISGSTLDSAEQLWARRNLAKEGNNFVAGDTEPNQLIYEPTIFDISDGTIKEIDLNKDSLIETLKQADYFYWSRHSGARTWYWNEGVKDWGENDQLFAKDIPPLKPVVIYSPTCKIFRPWEEDSIVLGFIDQGAVAYLGFLNSPHTIAFLKYGLFVPGITSWEEFPLGLVAQVGNKATTEVVFNSPQFFMIGDPRTYLSKEQPYQIVSDSENKSGVRIITGESDENGMLAVKIDDGADYNFVTISGLTSVSENDLFYNSKLQTLNLGADKYISFLHEGGRFEINLSRKAPLGWELQDTLIDVLDNSWVTLWLNNYSDSNPHIYALSLPFFILILGFQLIKRKRPLKSYGSTFLLALLWSLIRLSYYLIRLDHYTVSADPVSYTPLQVAIGSLGMFATTAGGLILMRDGKRKVSRAFGLILAVSRQLWSAGYRFAFITLLSCLTPISGMTRAWVWNYKAFWLLFVVLLIETAIVLVIYRIVIRDKQTRFVADES